MSQKESLEFSANASTADVAGYLEALARSLREGRALIESGDKSLALELASPIKVELEAESDPEKGKGSIEISLSWRAAQESVPEPSLTIVAGGQIPADAGAEGPESHIWTPAASEA
jgi:amphi-Trp domain-containing protein